jgi:hypothetical protein
VTVLNGLRPATERSASAMVRSEARLHLSCKASSTAKTEGVVSLCLLSAHHLSLC